jgi:mannose-1-phosphate guanylyltransferase
MPNDKLVVIHGLDGFIVVESDEILLICKKDQEQEIRQLVNRVKTDVGERYL